MKSGIAIAGDVAETIAEFALPGAIGKIVSHAIDSMTEDDRQDKQKIVNAIQTQLSAPEQLAKIKAIFADTQSARSMQIEALKQSKLAAGFHAITPAMLSYCITGILAGLIYLLFVADIQAQNKDLLLFFMGTITGVASSVFSYWFGSSMGQDENNKRII